MHQLPNKSAKSASVKWNGGQWNGYDEIGIQFLWRCLILGLPPGCYARYFCELPFCSQSLYTRGRCPLNTWTANHWQYGQNWLVYFFLHRISFVHVYCKYPAEWRKKLNLHFLTKDHILKQLTSHHWLIWCTWILGPSLIGKLFPSERQCYPKSKECLHYFQKQHDTWLEIEAFQEQIIYEFFTLHICEHYTFQIALQRLLKIGFNQDWPQNGRKWDCKKLTGQKPQDDHWQDRNPLLQV